MTRDQVDSESTWSLSPPFPGGCGDMLCRKLAQESKDEWDSRDEALRGRVCWRSEVPYPAMRGSLDLIQESESNSELLWVQMANDPDAHTHICTHMYNHTKTETEAQKGRLAGLRTKSKEAELGSHSIPTALGTWKPFPQSPQGHS